MIYDNVQQTNRSKLLIVMFWVVVVRRDLFCPYASQAENEGSIPFTRSRFRVRRCASVHDNRVILSIAYLFALLFGCVSMVMVAQFKEQL